MANRNAQRIEKLEAIEKVGFHYVCPMIFLHRAFDEAVTRAKY